MTTASLRSALIALLAVAVALTAASGASAQLEERPVLRKPSADSRAAALYDEGIALAASGQDAAAEESLQKALAIAPRHRDARTALAVVLARADRYADALALLEEGRRIDPLHAPYTVLAARLRADAGDAEAALRLLDTLPAAAVTPASRALRAALCQRRGRYEDAARLYRELLRQEPRRGLWWLGLALAQEGGGLSSEALAAYRNARRAGDLDAAPGSFVDARIAALESGDAAPPAAAERR